MVHTCLWCLGEGTAFLAGFLKGIKVTTQIVSVWHLVCREAHFLPLFCLGEGLGVALIFYLSLIRFVRRHWFVVVGFPSFAGVTLLGFDFVRGRRTHCCGTKAVICGLQMLPNKCGATLVKKRSNRLLCTEQSLSPYHFFFFFFFHFSVCRVHIMWSLRASDAT